MHDKVKIRFILFGVLVLIANSASLADDVQASLPVSVTVIPACILSTPTPVAFGNYNPTSTEDDQAQGAVSLNCTKGTAYTIALNAGTAQSATATNRRMMMSGGTDELNYDLYQDAAYTKHWGSTTDVDMPPKAMALGKSEIIPVYGRIKPQQSVAAGNYSDQVTINLNF